MSLSFDSPFVISSAAMSSALILLKLTCVLLTAVVVSALMRRRSAGARHLVWLVALGVALVLPVWSAWSPLSVHVLPAAPPPVIGATSVAKTPAAGSAPVEVSPKASRTLVTPAPASRSIGTGTMLLAIWALGVVVLLARLALG